MERFLPYDEETARAIANAGRRMIRKVIRKFSSRYDWKQNVTVSNAI